jgi:predicted nucleotidyltransferase
MEGTKGISSKGIRPLTSNEEIIESSLKVIKSFFPESRIIIFGSRARGNYKPNSDLDVAIDIGKPIPGYLMELLREKLDELPTLVSFDLVDFHRISKEFQKQIIKTGKVIYDGRTSSGS